MGKGNVCVFKPYEGLYYIDNQNLSVYRENGDLTEDPEDRLLRDLSYEDLSSWHYDEIGSMYEEEDVLVCFTEGFLRKFPSFSKVTPKDQWISRSQRAILENKLFSIAVEDNEWSLAVELLQKEDPYGDSLAGLQKKHYQAYLKGIRDSLLDRLPSIGAYAGAWTHKVITQEDIAKAEKQA